VGEQDRGERATVLIVESDFNLARRLRESIERLGVQALTVGDGLEALRWLRGSRPQLILADQAAPWVDGFRICRLTKFHKKTQEIPVFILTAVKDEDHLRLARQVRADGYLEKKDLQPVIQKVRQILIPQTPGS
jgi:CheY-like chemotaxis protein